MPLIDRIFRDDPDPAREINTHAWSAAMWFLAKGSITQQNVIDAFTLDATDQIQFQQLITHYNGLTATEKSEFHSSLESAGILAQSKMITKTQYKSLLGLT